MKLSIGDLLTPEEAARIIGCRPETLAKWRVTGKGPAFYKPTGRRVVYAVNDIDAWFRSTRMEGSAVGPAPPAPQNSKQVRNRRGGYRTRGKSEGAKWSDTL